MHKAVLLKQWTLSLLWSSCSGSANNL